jgi:hypothetical protein
MLTELDGGNKIHVVFVGGGNAVVFEDGEGQMSLVGRQVGGTEVVSFNYWLNVRKTKWIQSPLTVWTAHSFYV